MPFSKAAASEGQGVPFGAHGATNKEHHVCARRRVVRRPGLRWGSDRCEHADWEKARPWAKRLSWQTLGGRVK